MTTPTQVLYIFFEKKNIIDPGDLSNSSRCSTTSLLSTVAKKIVKWSNCLFKIVVLRCCECLLWKDTVIKLFIKLTFWEVNFQKKSAIIWCTLTSILVVVIRFMQTFKLISTNKTGMSNFFLLLNAFVCRIHLYLFSAQKACKYEKIKLSSYWDCKSAPTLLT